MNTENKYIRITKGLNDRGILINPKDIDKVINGDFEHDYFRSLCFYNDAHKQIFDRENSVAGIRDTKTDILAFDFDDKIDPENARKDALELLNRLKAEKVPKSAVEIYFSGNKGYHIIVNLESEITPDQAKHLALNHFGKGLRTLDTVIYNPARVFRIPGTRHQSTGLYKTPLSIKEITENDTESIRNLASTIREGKTESETNSKRYNPGNLLRSVPNAQPERSERKTTGTEGSGPGISFDLSKRPRGWKLSRWAIAQGYFEPGERNESMMILAATCRGMGEDLLGAYYRCKSSLEKHMQRTGREDKFDKGELFGICERVFSDSWEGGSYSDDHPLIKKICERLSIPVKEKNLVTAEEAFQEFKQYAKNIDALTIKTGIEELDKKLRITIGMSVGIIAPPAAGKTSVALQIVNNMSLNGHLSIVFSYDMYKNLLTQKLVQKHMGVSADRMFEEFKFDNKQFEAEAKEIVKKEYANVAFCFESGQTIEDITQTIEDCKNKFGKEPKLIVVDYNELVVTDISDPTQSSAFVAQKLRQIANDYNLCVLSLFQPSKLGNGGPEQEITSYRSAKGSSAIEQAASVLLGVSRPGFDPRHPENDRYITINCLKNRMGSIFSLDLHWDGQKGEVRSLKPNEKMELEQMREEKEAEKNEGWE